MSSADVHHRPATRWPFCWLTLAITLAVLGFAQLAVLTVNHVTRQMAVGSSQDLARMLADWARGPILRRDWAALNNLVQLHAAHPSLRYLAFVVYDAQTPREFRNGANCAVCPTGADAPPAEPHPDLPDWARLRVTVYGEPAGSRDPAPRIGEVRLGIDPQRGFLLAQQARTWFWSTAAALGGLLALLILLLWRRLMRERQSSLAAAPRLPRGDDHDTLSAQIETLLHRETQVLRDLALRDPLTGLYNRRHFNEVFQQRFDEARRYGDTLCLAVIDVDNFKRTNDLFGHTAGDAVLMTLAATVRADLRSSDTCARFGGDEFVVLMPQTRLPDARHVLERMQTWFREVCSARFPELPVTLSIGVVQSSPDVADPERLFALADEAMYDAKHAGKDRLCARIAGAHSAAPRESNPRAAL